MTKLIHSLLVLVGFGFISAFAEECPVTKCEKSPCATKCPSDKVCYQAPCGNPWKIASVKWVLSHDKWAVDGKKIVLIGKVVKKDDEDTYFLDDGTGLIELDSDIALPVGKRVVVHGKIDYAFFGERNTQFNVTEWRLESKPGKLSKE